MDTKDMFPTTYTFQWKLNIPDVFIFIFAQWSFKTILKIRYSIKNTNEVCNKEQNLFNIKYKIHWLNIIPFIDLY